MELALATDSVTALLLPLLATQHPRGCNRSNVPPLVGAGVGVLDGTGVGPAVGATDGAVGPAVGTADGAVGAAVGAADGSCSRIRRAAQYRPCRVGGAP